MKTRSGIFGTAGWFSLKFRFNKARISGIHFHGDLIGEKCAYLYSSARKIMLLRE